MSDEVYLLRILETLFRRRDIAALWADADLRVRYATPQASRLLAAEAPVGRLLPEVCPELVGMEASLREIARRRTPPFFLKHIHRDAPDGRVRYISITAYAPPQEHPDGLVLFLEETTAEGKLLQELNQSRNELRLMRRQLEQVNRFKSLSLAIASHEIGGRLGMMLSYTDLLGLEKGLSANGREMLAIIRWGIHTLTMSLRQLISLDQIERGQLSLELHPCNLTALAQHVWKVYLAPVQAQFALHQELSPRPVFVQCDENRMHQVLYNLISNAVKYTPEGERITLGLTQEGSEALLWVENTGVGIQAADRQRLFRPYFRTSDSQRLRKPGTGLGLFIVRQLVEAHGGRVEVDSRPQEYTRFTVRLPLHPPTPEETP